MSLMEAVALTYLVSAVIVIGVVPMLLSDHPPAWLVQADPYDEDWWKNELGSIASVDVFDRFSNIPLPGGHGCQRKMWCGADNKNERVGIQKVAV
jgi:hypothetical protein